MNWTLNYQKDERKVLLLLDVSWQELCTIKEGQLLSGLLTSLHIGAVRSPRTTFEALFRSILVPATPHQFVMARPSAMDSLGNHICVELHQYISQMSRSVCTSIRTKFSLLGMEKALRIDPFYNHNSSSLGLFSRKKSVIKAYLFQLIKQKGSAYAVQQSLTFFEGWFSSRMALTMKVFRL